MRRPSLALRVWAAATCIFGVCSALDPHLMLVGARSRPLQRQQWRDFSASEPETAGGLISGPGQCSAGPARATAGFVAAPCVFGNRRNYFGTGSLGSGGSACSWLHGRSMAASASLGRRRLKSPKSGGILGMNMLFGRLVIQAERQFISGMTGHVARVWGFAIAALPDILNLTIVAILLYAAVISCGPIFNELLWTPDDADRPPIEGRKWSDFDKPMQDILRTYKNGDVAPSGDHIEGWNRQVRRRQMRLENTIQAARRYKRALEAERKMSSEDPDEDSKRGRLRLFMKKFRSKFRLFGSERLLMSAQKAKEEYIKAKADYMQEGTYSASFIRPKKYGSQTLVRDQTALEQADEQNEEAELQAMLSKLKEMKDQPMYGEVVDTTSQFGARSLEDLVSSEQAFTRLWPKAVAPDGIHRDVSNDGQDIARRASTNSLMSVSKEDRLRGEKLPGAPDQKKTYSLFGTKRTMMLSSDSQDQKKEKFGIPIMFVVIPSVSFTLWAYYHVLTTAIAFCTAVIVAVFWQSWKPVQICSAVTFSQFLNAYAACLGVLTGGLSVLAGIGTIVEAIIMTIADGFAFALATIFVPLISVSAETFSRTSFRSASMQKWMSQLVSAAITLLPADSLQAQKLSSLDINGNVERKTIPEVAFVTSSSDKKDSLTTLKGDLLLIQRSHSIPDVLPDGLE